MNKVKFFDARLIKTFLQITSAISASLSLALIFTSIPESCKLNLGIGFLILLLIIYVTLWLRSNSLENINLNIEGSIVCIKTGDIFEQEGFKAIAFNEYFDTLVDDVIISKASLNGIYINKHFSMSTKVLDDHIDNYRFEPDQIAGNNEHRFLGKQKKYKIGTICVYKEFILAAFSKFDEGNRALLSMPEYLEFLINFWDKINNVYAQKSVNVPIFGSGITRIKEHKNITDEDLLKIMLWTFRISEMRFKYPAKLNIIIHKEKIKKINLLDVKYSKYGL